MISAINNNINNRTSFTSVVPVRVRIDNLETFEKTRITAACKKLGEILIGPTKESDTRKINILKQFAKHDPEYNFLSGLNGFPKQRKKKKVVQSDYFRHIYSQYGHFFISGCHAEIINKKGIDIGLAEQNCKIHELTDSIDLKIAKATYWNTIKKFITDRKLRITEDYNTATGEKTGNPVTLIINLKSNGKYGKTTFKMDVDSIEFQQA